MSNTIYNESCAGYFRARAINGTVAAHGILSARGHFRHVHSLRFGTVLIHRI